VCTGVHALASVRSVEDALGIQIPKNANIIRNLMHATLFAQDHLVHFYHLHALDWVDVVSALKADPKTSEIQQSISPWPNSSPGYFREVQNRLKKFVESGQLGIFANAYWGHPAYKLPPEVNLLAVTHYLEALDFQKEIVKIQTIFGGKNPHPNWLVGGVPCDLNVDGAGAIGAVNMALLNMVEQHRQPHDRVHRPGLHPRSARDRRLLQGLGAVGRRTVEQERHVVRRLPGHSERLQQQQHAAAVRRHPQRRPEERARRRPEGSGAGAGMGHPLLVQVRRRVQGPAPVRRRHRPEVRASARPRAPRPTSRKSTSPPSIRGSSRRAGRATRSRSARWHATWSRTRAATRRSRSRSTAR
jgi:hypothetical protein